MVSGDLITETIAVRLTGVSGQTLQRFAEAGYFQLEEDSSGERLYSRHSLASVFGLPLTDDRVIDIELGKMAPFEASPVQAQSVETPVILPVAETTPAAVADGVAELAPVEQEVVAAAQPEETPLTEKQIETPAATAPSSTLADTRLEAIVEMHEKLLDKLERENRELKEERDWLRIRIERLEDKAERDQLLLLAETQTVKRLVSLQVQRKTAVRQALEWFGFLPPTNDLGERLALPGSQNKEASPSRWIYVRE